MSRLTDKEIEQKAREYLDKVDLESSYYLPDYGLDIAYIAGYKNAREELMKGVEVVEYEEDSDNWVLNHLADVLNILVKDIEAIHIIRTRRSRWVIQM